jgi:hypothetical protein
MKEAQRRLPEEKLAIYSDFPTNNLCACTAYQGSERAAAPKIGSKCICRLLLFSLGI